MKFFRKRTGNPFVDVGISVIEKWSDKDISDVNKEDLKKLSKQISDLYITDKWKKSLYQIFPNNPITNPSVKDKKERYLNFLLDLINNLEPISDHGNCISCGSRDSIEKLGRDKVPLTGSKNFINYYSFGMNGVDYCPGCELAIQFIPLGIFACSGKMLLMNSNSDYLMSLWTSLIKKQIYGQIASNEFTGCINKGFSNPRNAIFDIIGEIVREEYEMGLEEEYFSINFYFFTNYNQSPSMDLINLPSDVFIFLSDITRHDKYNDWLRVVRKGYVYNVDKLEEKGKEYKNVNNLVYNNLLENKSIISYFINKKDKESIGGWDLISDYLIEVRHMKEERVEVIKNVADKISEYIKEENKPDLIYKIEKASNYTTFLNVIRKIIKNRIKDGKTEKLFTFDEFSQYLIPEGKYWRETQELLLFRIYENLHNWLVEEDLENNNMEEEDND